MKTLICPNCKKEIDPVLVEDKFKEFREELEQKNKEKVNALVTAEKAKDEQAWILREEKINTKHRLEMESLKTTVKQLQKKTNQGLAVHQGSAQEIVLGNYLRGLYPEDKFSSFEKGEAGADWLQEVKNPQGEVIGKILYESKDDRNFSNKWEPKLQNDMKASNADIGVIYTMATPRNFNKKLGFQNSGNIYICEFDPSSLKTLIFGLRMNFIFKDRSKVKGKSNLLSANELLENPKVLNFLASMKRKHAKRLKTVKQLETIVTKSTDFEKESQEEFDDLLKLLEELAGLKFPFGDK